MDEPYPALHRGLEWSGWSRGTGPGRLVLMRAGSGPTQFGRGPRRVQPRGAQKCSEALVSTLSRDGGADAVGLGPTRSIVSSVMQGSTVLSSEGT